VVPPLKRRFCAQFLVLELANRPLSALFSTEPDWPALL